MPGILSGIRVIEQGMFITGPYAASLLADLGAEVIKVERPGIGDPFRNFESGLYGPQFQAFNRNKKSIVLDLEQESERSILRDLLSTADVYLHNFRPGVAEKLGFGPGEIQALYPQLVYCMITGFGRDGPYAERPVYDTVAQGLSGYLSMFVSPDDPKVVGPAAADSVTGLYAAYAVLAAIVERFRTGKGRLVEISMLDAMLHFSVEQYQRYFATGVVPGPSERGQVSQSFAFRCADGKLIALHLSSPVKFWDGLVSAIDRPEIAANPLFASRMDRVRNHHALMAALRPVFAGRPRREWLDLLEKEDVPHAAVLNLAEALDDPQARFSGAEEQMVHPQEGTVRGIRNPVICDGERPLPMTPPPVLDEHGAAIRAEVERLRQQRNRKEIQG